MADILGRSSILVTGLEGSGKSHYVMTQVKKILDDPENEYQIFLANVDGVTLSHPKFQVVDPSFSWVDDAPQNSIVIYDEAGTIERFNNSHTKINSHIDVETLTMRRHKNVLVVFVTQDFKLVHSGLRSLLKFHYHFSNPYSSNKETKCFITAGVNDSGRKTIIEEFDHKLDPEIFPLYKSIQTGAKHDQKKVVNKKAKLLIKIAIAAILIAIPLFIGVGLLIKKIYNDQFNPETMKSKTTETITEKAADFSKAADPTANMDMNTAGNAELAQNNLDASRRLQLYEERLPPDYLATVNNDDLRVSGVVMMGGRCRAYNGHGEFINISQSECVGYTVNAGTMPKPNRSRQLVTTEHAAKPANNDDPAFNNGSNEVIGQPAALPQTVQPQPSVS